LYQLLIKDWRQVCWSSKSDTTSRTEVLHS